MTLVRNSRPEEKSRLKELWHIVFGDSEKSIDLFFDGSYQPERFLVVVEDDVITTMLVLLPLTLQCENGTPIPASYLYALATHPDYRGRGHAKRLLRFVHQYARERDVDCMVVVPAMPSLHQFFGEFDFEPTFATRHTTVTKEDLGQMEEEDTIAPATVEEYRNLRKEVLEKTQHVSYPEELISFQKEVSQLSGGNLYQISIAGEEGCMAVERVDENTVVVKELLVAPRDVKTALALLQTQVPATTYQVRTPAQRSGTPESQVHPFGMVRWYNRDSEHTWHQGGEGYMGLGFD